MGDQIDDLKNQIIFLQTENACLKKCFGDKKVSDKEMEDIHQHCIELQEEMKRIITDLKAELLWAKKSFLEETGQKLPEFEKRPTRSSPCSRKSKRSSFGGM